MQWYAWQTRLITFKYLTPYNGCLKGLSRHQFGNRFEELISPEAENCFFTTLLEVLKRALLRLSIQQSWRTLIYFQEHYHTKYPQKKRNKLQCDECVSNLSYPQPYLQYVHIVTNST